MAHYIYKRLRHRSVLLVTLSNDKQSSRRPCVLLSSFSNRLCDTSRVRNDTKPATYGVGILTETSHIIWKISHSDR
jgi:hypothetical protein